MRDPKISFVSPALGAAGGLSVVLHDPHGRPPHELLRQLYEVVNAWRTNHPEARLRTASGDSLPQTVTEELASYLYATGEINGARLSRHLDMLLELGSLHRFGLRPGAPVEGRDLIGRKEAGEKLIQYLAADRSVHLAAPRRYGKSSLLRFVNQRLNQEGRPCVMVDLSSGTSATWFFVTLALGAMECAGCRAALEQLPELKGWPAPGARPIARSDAGKELARKLGDAPWSFGKRLLDAIAEARGVLILDEFSVFLRAAVQQHPDEAQQVAARLAAARSEAPQVLAGSAGLSSYIAFHKLGGEFGDLQMLELPPLDRGWGEMLAEELFYGADHPPTAEAVAATIDEVGEVVPYFVHVLVDAVCTAHQPGAPLDRRLVELAYADRVLGPWGNHVFKAYRLGAQPYPSELRLAAARLLGLVAGSADGASREALKEAFDKIAPSVQEPQVLESLLGCLAEDYDLVEQEGRWRMRCKVIRERWALNEAWLTEDARS
jgi:hypothetical protein